MTVLLGIAAGGVLALIAALTGFIFVSSVIECVKESTLRLAGHLNRGKPARSID